MSVDSVAKSDGKGNSTHFSILRDGKGQVIVVDGHEKRLNAMHRRIYAWARVVLDSMVTQKDSYLIHVTLTYDPKLPNGRGTWSPKDVNNFLRVINRRHGDDVLGYAWVAELQSRGEVHYHIMFWVVKGTRFRMPDKRGGGWTHGASSVARRRSPFYLVKYVKKMTQKRPEYPKGCRMYAVSVRISDDVPVDAVTQYRLSSAPDQVRGFLHKLGVDKGLWWRRGTDWDSVTSGWWVGWQGGKCFLPSQWEWLSSVATEGYAAMLAQSYRASG